MKSDGGISICRFATRALVIWMFAALALMGTAMADITRTGLVAEYHFDEGSGNIATDSSGNGNNGLIHGASWVDGKFGKALVFNGVSDYVTTNINGFPSGSNPRTLAAWIKTSASTQMTIVGYGNNTSSQMFNILTLSNTGKIIVSNWGGLTALSDTAINDGAWHFVAATYDGTTVRIYIDGILEVTDSSLTFNTINAFSKIGVRIDGTTEFYNGIIDEVRIYNRALSADEVLANYQAGQIIITSSPSGAEVLINGQSKGVANPTLTVYGISPSSYAVKCKLAGYSDYDTNVVLTASSVANVNCALQLAPTTPPTTAPSTPPTTAPTTPTEVLVPGPSASPPTSTQPSTALTPTLTPTPAPASITGRITDARTGDPVQGATIAIDGTSSISDANGNYDQTVGVGKHNLSVIAQGYETLTRPIAVPEGGMTLDLTLKSTSSDQSWLWIVIILIIVAVAAGIIYLLYRKKNKKTEENKKVEAKKETVVEKKKFCMFCHAPMPTDAEFCPKCGKKQDETKRFCMNCGALMPAVPELCGKCSKMPPSDVDTKTCKNCGEVLPVVAKFCSACGAGQPG